MYRKTVAKLLFCPSSVLNPIGLLIDNAQNIVTLAIQNRSDVTTSTSHVIFDAIIISLIAITCSDHSHNPS